MTNSSLCLKGCFEFDPLDPIYLDHFPGSPIVPGNLIIKSFCETIMAHLEHLERHHYHSLNTWPFIIKKFQFIQFTLPGKSYHYQINSSEECERYDCFLFDYHESSDSFDKAAIYAKGTLVLCKSSIL